MNQWPAILFILLGGFAGALQARVLGNVEAKVGILGNMFLNFALGFAFSLLIISTYSLLQYQNPIKLYQEFHLSRVNAFEMTAGLFGIIIVTSIGFSASRIGVSGTLILFLFSQILLGIVIDHFGWMGGQVFALTPTKIVAIITMGLGIYLFFR